MLSAKFMCVATTIFDCVCCCCLPHLLLQRCHSAVRAIGYDDKSGLIIVAGDGGSSSSSSSSLQTSADAFASEGATLSAWQLGRQQQQQQQQRYDLQLKFSLGRPPGGSGLLLSGAAALLGVDAAAAAATAAELWCLAFSPLLEYVALLTGAGRCGRKTQAGCCLIITAACGCHSMSFIVSFCCCFCMHAACTSSQSRTEQ
jgi:hypothetical protein